MALRVRLQHPKGECRASLLAIMQAAALQQAVINFRSNALMRHLSVRLQRHCSRREVTMHWSGALMRCLSYFLRNGEVLQCDAPRRPGGCGS